MSGQQPPHDIDAERYTLAAMMERPEGIEAVVDIVEPKDFYRPWHSEIFTALVFMYAAQETITPPTLIDYLIKSTGDLDGFRRAGMDKYILELYHLGSPWVMAHSHAKIVRDRAVRRRLRESGIRLQQMSAQLDYANLSELLGRAVGELEDAGRFTSLLDLGRDDLLNAKEFVDSPAAQPVVLIPGLLNRQDRVVVVANEGSGKTMIAYQVAVAAACGIHPFWPVSEMPPIRSMIIDLENPRYDVRDKLLRMLRVAEYQAGYQPDSVQVFSRPRGINLSNPGEAHMLAAKIRQANPDLIIAGPIYKMFNDKGERGDHDVVSDFWDLIRDRHDCALWLETHAPIFKHKGQRDMRPMGSGLWSRWPEFGVALIPAKADEGPGALEVGTFRGHRQAERQWPELLTHNRSMNGSWPWMARYAEGIMTAPLAS